MGKVRVTVQTEKRLSAITELSIAIRNVAEALSAQAVVNISDCTFSNNDIGANIDTAEEVTETMVFEEKE